MASKLGQFVERVLIMTSQQLSLCCHREVGNIPLETLRRRNDPRSNRDG
ncbi:hypothetical protein [Novosphingobium sp. M1R2S20]|uniref:Uncharacterized protein n=1 Tax=Novosphingobium rhizovicinum TaxID=3228928 RepID=A0ABV3RG48_9SPHN